MTPSPFPPYTPDAPPPRRARALELLTRDLTWRDLATGVIALAAIIVALGWSLNSPGKRLDAFNVRLDTVERSFSRRMMSSERRIDTLAEQQRFTNYLLCTQIRRTDPASAPPDCAPLIEARRAR